MIKRTSIALFLISSCAINAQIIEDSVIYGNSFKLKKNKITFELGKSPGEGIYFHPHITEWYEKRQPFFKLSYTRNIHLGKQWYFTPALGFSMESHHLGVRSLYTYHFISSDTVAGGGTVHYYEYKNYWNTRNVYHRRYSATLDLSVQKVCSLFRNTKFKFAPELGVTLKPSLHTTRRVSNENRIDSTIRSQAHTIHSEQYTSYHQTAFRLSQPIDVQPHFKFGFIYDGRFAQQQFGINFLLQFQTRYRFDPDYQRKFIRVYYGINF